MMYGVWLPPPHDGRCREFLKTAAVDRFDEKGRVSPIFPIVP